MALQDLAVFNEWVQTAMTEVAAQQLNLFNDASSGCITLRNSANIGDFRDVSSFKLIPGLIRRRNPYGTGALTSVALKQLLDTSVRVAAGTQPVALDPSQWRWIGMDPQAAGAALGQQIAVGTVQDMLNTAVLGMVGAMLGNSGAIYDETASADSVKTMTLGAQNKASAIFGDRANNIRTWVMHSAVMHALWGNSIAGNNGNQFLFRYENLNIVSDPWGRRYIVSDIPALNAGGGKYYTLGLQPGAVVVEQNTDYDSTMQELTQAENIKRIFQAEWSFQLGLYGYTWNKASGGHAPTDASLAMSTSWSQIATDVKNTAGVLLITN